MIGDCQNKDGYHGMEGMSTEDEVKETPKGSGCHGHPEMDQADPLIALDKNEHGAKKKGQQKKSACLLFLTRKKKRTVGAKSEEAA